MAAPLKVGLAGLGTVGASVVRLIDQQRSVLADKCERIGQNVERRCQSAAHRPHLEVITFFGLAVMIEHRFCYTRYS